MRCSSKACAELTAAGRDIVGAVNVEGSILEPEVCRGAWFWGDRSGTGKETVGSVVCNPDEGGPLQGGEVSHVLCDSIASITD